MKPMLPIRDLHPGAIALLIATTVAALAAGCGKSVDVANSPSVAAGTAPGAKPAVQPDPEPSFRISPQPSPDPSGEPRPTASGSPSPQVSPNPAAISYDCVNGVRGMLYFHQTSDDRLVRFRVGLPNYRVGYVRVDGQIVPYAYEREGQSVVIPDSDSGHAGSEISVETCNPPFRDMP